MAKFKNVGPLGALDIDVLGLRGVEVGEVFEVPDHLALGFIGQTEIYEAVDVPESVREEFAALVAADAAEAGEPVADVEAETPEPRRRAAKAEKGGEGE
ncbi:MAG: hypothetical protein IJO71_11410 [Microbacterium sp.]|uniref:hypothetical protein n=1 Tax=Microbacterium sp. TaxID=51671 RepID=UPI0025D36C29|nr:hypothetical protein [Microbacterium sp.]MBQ9917791.1 hypothetical protein [Microbacterium sp.]